MRPAEEKTKNEKKRQTRMDKEHDKKGDKRRSKVKEHTLDLQHRSDSTIPSCASEFATTFYLATSFLDGELENMAGVAADVGVLLGVILSKFTRQHRIRIHIIRPIDNRKFWILTLLTKVSNSLKFSGTGSLPLVVVDAGVGRFRVEAGKKNLSGAIEIRRLILKNGPNSSSQTIRRLSSHTVYTIRDEFLFKTERKYIDEIVEVKKESMCAVLGTIKFIEEEHGWYYISCRKCSRKVVRKSERTEFEDIVVSDKTDDDPLENTLYRGLLVSIQHMAKDTAPVSLTFAPFYDGHDNGIQQKTTYLQFVTDYETNCTCALAEIISSATTSGKPFDHLVYTTILPWAARVANNHSVNFISRDSNDPMFLINLPGLPPLKFVDLPLGLLSSCPKEHKFLIPLFKDHIDVLTISPRILVNTFNELEIE
ncbi:crocetin glucosyltransferase, chloroplastic-like protein [Tanacetum coccineum]